MRNESASSSSKLSTTTTSPLFLATHPIPPRVLLKIIFGIFQTLPVQFPPMVEEPPNKSSSTPSLGKMTKPHSISTSTPSTIQLAKSGVFLNSLEALSSPLAPPRLQPLPALQIIHFYPVMLLRPTSTVFSIKRPLERLQKMSQHSPPPSKTNV